MSAAKFHVGQRVPIDWWQVVTINNPAPQSDFDWREFRRGLIEQWLDCPYENEQTEALLKIAIDVTPFIKIGGVE